MSSMADSNEKLSENKKTLKQEKNDDVKKIKDKSESERGKVSAELDVMSDDKKKDLSENISSDLTKSPELKEKKEKGLFSLKYFNSVFGALKKNAEKFDQISGMEAEEKEKFVLSVKKKVEEVKFLIEYIGDTYGVEIVGGHEIYKESEGSKLDLTKASNSLKEIETKMGKVAMYKDLEALRESIKPKDFFKLPLEERLRLISNIHSWNELKADTLVVFNFGSNDALYYQVGLGDVMPPSIRELTVGNRTYQRRGSQGFYSNGRYLAISTGTRVTIGKEDKNYSPDEELKRRFTTDHSKIEEKDILKTARDFMVDPYFLKAVVSEIKEDSENSISDPEEFLHIAGRYIQNAENRYEASNGSAIEGGHYSVDFVSYALDRFALFNEYKEMPEKSILKIIDEYNKFPGVILNYKKKNGAKKAVRYEKKSAPARVRKQREKSKPPRRRGREKGKELRQDYRGELRYDENDLAIGSRESRARVEKRIRAFLNSPTARNMSSYKRNLNVKILRKLYSNMESRQGKAYSDRVTIKSADDTKWTIPNKCVGHAMAVSAGLPFAVLSGRQKNKRRYASNYKWGDKSHYIRNLSASSETVLREKVTPGNVDALVGRHLAVGEAAVADFWDHVFWIYKEPDGTIMINHSGVDVRPRRITVAMGKEVPSGYSRKSGSTLCTRDRGSKVNELPLAYFLSKRQNKYAPPWNTIRFATVSSLVTDNLNDSKRGGDFRRHFGSAVA